jgi:hypothetical protein
MTQTQTESVWADQQIWSWAPTGDEHPRLRVGRDMALTEEQRRLFLHNISIYAQNYTVS